MLTKQVSGERKLPYASSVGCPYACNYCTDTVFYKRRFNAYSAAEGGARSNGAGRPPSVE